MKSRLSAEFLGDPEDLTTVEVYIALMQSRHQILYSTSSLQGFTLEIPTKCRLWCDLVEQVKTSLQEPENEIILPSKQRLLFKMLAMRKRNNHYPQTLWMSARFHQVKKGWKILSQFLSLFIPNIASGLTKVTKIQAKWCIWRKLLRCIIISKERSENKIILTFNVCELTNAQRKRKYKRKYPQTHSFKGRRRQSSWDAKIMVKNMSKIHFCKGVFSVKILKNLDLVDLTYWKSVHERVLM